jgi:NAD(P)-dependent dehydrogenase (short-subunit alcohol dehydrogenase family)
MDYLIYSEGLFLVHQPGKSAGLQRERTRPCVSGSSQELRGASARRLPRPHWPPATRLSLPRGILPPSSPGWARTTACWRHDVTNEAEAHKAAAQTIEKFGRIDILVNNAGYSLLAAIEEASAEETAKLFGTNVFGLLNVTRAVLPHMRRQRAGHIINVSSVGGYAGSPGWGVYGATKFAVEGISEALVGEVTPLGIHVTVVEPGFFRADFLTKPRWPVPHSRSTIITRRSARRAPVPLRSITASAAIRVSWRKRLLNLRMPTIRRPGCR